MIMRSPSYHRLANSKCGKALPPEEQHWSKLQMFPKFGVLKLSHAPEIKKKKSSNMGRRHKRGDWLLFYEGSPKKWGARTFSSRAKEWGITIFIPSISTESLQGAFSTTWWRPKPLTPSLSHPVPWRRCISTETRQNENKNSSPLSQKTNTSNSLTSSLLIILCCKLQF